MRCSAIPLALLLVLSAGPAAGGVEYSTEVTSLIGLPYGGHQGAVPDGPVDFGHGFVSIKRAYLDLEGSTVLAAPLEFTPLLDGVMGPTYRMEEPIKDWSVTLELPVPLTARDGEGYLEIRIVIDACCDWNGDVTAATMRVESDLVPGSLLERPLLNEDNFGGDLGPGNNRFGNASAYLGDVDGDGTGDLAVTDRFDSPHGAVWILFMNDDGTVRNQQEISGTEGGYLGDGAQSLIGVHVAAIGDIDGNGVPDLATAPDWFDNGYFWVFRLNADGTLLGEQRIAPGVGGFAGTGTATYFPVDIAGVGDLDGDGRGELAVSDPGTNTAGTEVGSVWILFFNADGTVRDEVEITSNQSGFDVNLPDNALFGRYLASGDDLDGDGRNELAVSTDAGDAWNLFLAPDGTVTRTETQPGCMEILPGDMDGDGIGDLLCTDRLVTRNLDGTIKGETPLNRMRNGWGLDAFPELTRIPGNDDCSFRFAGSAWRVDEEFGIYEGLMLPILDGSGSMEVQVERDTVRWCTPPRASGFDLIRGDLGTLRSTGGDFAAAVTGCLADDLDAGEQAHLPLPGPGEGFFFMVRRITDDGAGSFDSKGRGVDGPRDALIAASGNACN